MGLFERFPTKQNVANKSLIYLNAKNNSNPHPPSLDFSHEKSVDKYLIIFRKGMEPTYDGKYVSNKCPIHSDLEANLVRTDSE